MTRRDEFDDDDNGLLKSILSRRTPEGGVRPGSLRRVLAATAGLAVLGILGAVLWSTWPEERGEALDESNVPIIRADADPYKTAPEEPGGMDVPNKDSTIFNTLKGERDKKAGPENLFEDSEQPVRKEDVFTAEPAPATPDEQKLEPAENRTAEVKESEAAPPTAVTAVEPVTPAAPAPAPEKQEAKKADAVQPAAGGNFYVQLAAVKSEADAKTQWPKYQAKYSELSRLSLRVQKADLGAKGTYYRIQGGPVSEPEARKLCASINTQKAGSCVVAKR
jgi:hypothetical protein